MKAKIKSKTELSKLKNKIYLKLIIIVAIAAILVLFLLSLAQGNASVLITDFLQNKFDLSKKDAITIFRYTIINNLNYIIVITVTIFFIILARFLLSQFTKYFGEVNSGIDKIIADHKQKVYLAPEIYFMENKLNDLRENLLQKEQETKLAEQNKNDLVMYLAHDLKTPLTSIIGYLSLLSEAPDMPIKQKAKFTNIALDKAYRLESLINEFFEITRYNFQTITLDKKIVDLHYMLIQMAEEFYPQLSTQNKSIKIDAPENILIYADPDKLARVFNNILKNAIAYGKDNSIIEITVKTIDNNTSVSIKNEGTISKSNLSTIFDKFFRLDSARSSSTGSAGLGLAIAKEIIELHKGKIYATSDNGQTIFIVELPS